MILQLFWFLFGEALHVLAQVDAIARSKSNPQTSRIEFFKSRGINYAVRIALASAIFMLWLEGGLIAVLTATGMQLPEMVTRILSLHITGSLAVLAGYVADSALGYMPFLKSADITVDATKP